MLTYLFTFSILLLVFSFGYYVFMRQKPTLASRRRVLLFGLLVVVMIPLLPAPSVPEILSSNPVHVEEFTNWIGEEATLDEGAEIAVVALATSSTPDLVKETGIMFLFKELRLLMALYFLGVLLLLGRTGIGLYRLSVVHRGSTKVDDNLRILRGKGDAFTFGPTVYVSQSVYDSGDFDVVLAHERAHAQQWHTFDALIAEVLCAVFWFHPLIWWVRDQVKINLEYLADEAVLQAGYNKRTYQLSLVAHQHGTDFRTSLLPQFAAKGLKRRIKMMGFRAGSQVRSSVAMGGLIFLAFTAFALTNGKAVAQQAAQQATTTTATAPETNFISLFDGEAAELNIYFRRLPTPAELNLLRQPLREYFNRDIYVYQSCADPAGTFTFASSSARRSVHGLKLTADQFTQHPQRFQFTKDGNGGTGGATFRPHPLPADAPAGDVVLQLNGEWITISADDKTPYHSGNLNTAPRGEQIKCQLGLTPETIAGFNVGINTYGNSNPSYISGTIDGFKQAANDSGITTHMAFYIGQKKVDQDAFLEQAGQPDQQFTTAERVGDSDIFIVLRLDPR